MDPMARRGQYFRIYRELATQLRDYNIALDWYRIDLGHADGISAEDAAAWANAGYLPQEARPLIVQDVTPDMALAIEDIDRGDASSEEYAMRVMDRLIAVGQIRLAKPGEITD